jgi:antirestriction protein ArdC
MKSEQIKDAVKQATDRLAASLQAGQSELLRKYLQAVGRFHRYSWGNVLLIASQKPCATYVAGFHTWHKFGRFVRKGEKGILILAPILRRKSSTTDEEQEMERVCGFRAAYVFDVSQTDGEELPQLGVVQGNPESFLDALLRFAAQHTIAIDYSTDIAPARGVSRGGSITLLPAQSPAEEFSTLVHEVAHELLHRGDRRADTSKHVRETEAEAVAFVVCDAIGLDTGSAASDYIQLWKGSAELLSESLSHVQWAAAQILRFLTASPASDSDASNDFES